MGNSRKYKINLDTLAKILFVFSLCFLSFVCGYLTRKYLIFPYSLWVKARTAAENLIKGESYYYKKTDYKKKLTYDRDAAYSGLTLITAVVENDSLAARIIDIDGTLVHEWSIDWFDIWPNATHIPKVRLPVSRPGTEIHGAVLLDNGDLVFNFHGLGLVRLDVCGNVVWRLPYLTHHSIYRDEYNNLWVAGEKWHETPLSDFPNYRPPFQEPTILKVSEDGKILDEISIMRLLKENGLQGLLYIPGKDTSGDYFHLNDVETFPSFMKEGVFKAGDIMVSLKCINTILIFGQKDRKVKYLITGEFIGQHDPDFIDGNTISIFDNNCTGSEEYSHQSRILIKSFKNNQTYIYYTGNKRKRFHTPGGGKHQWLPNGNLLITETFTGRAFEVDKKGNIVWEYVNIVEKGYAGDIQQAERLPNKYTKEFFERRIKECRK